MEITVEAVQLPVYWVKDNRKGFTYDHVKGEGSTNPDHTSFGQSSLSMDRPESGLQIVTWKI